MQIVGFSDAVAQIVIEGKVIGILGSTQERRVLTGNILQTIIPRKSDKRIRSVALLELILWPTRQTRRFYLTSRWQCLDTNYVD